MKIKLNIVSECTLDLFYEDQRVIESNYVFDSLNKNIFSLLNKIHTFEANI